MVVPIRRPHKREPTASNPAMMAVDDSHAEDGGDDGVCCGAASGEEGRTE
jgi:hypothetical protein